jgi:hypothetical protein
MERIKKLEYPWIFKAAFTVNAYTVKHNNGKKYVVYAHNFTDMDTFLTRLEVFEGGLYTYQKDCFDHFETRKSLSYIPDKNGNPKKKPFWYRGRVYELYTNS